MIKKLSLFISVLFLLAGCTGLSSKQEPAPVFDNSGTANQSAIKKKTPQKVAEKATVKVIQAPVILKQQEIAIEPKVQPPSSNVVVALLSDADLSYQQGDYDDSVATLERALRIEPRNPLLLYKLARIRLQQGQPELAENLAKKSALFAEGDTQLKRKNWLLIAEAREQNNNHQGADAARKKAQQY